MLLGSLHVFGRKDIKGIIPFFDACQLRCALSLIYTKPQLPVERSATLVSSAVVERRRCALQVNSVARVQGNKETLRFHSTCS